MLYEVLSLSTMQPQLFRFVPALTDSGIENLQLVFSWSE